MKFPDNRGAAARALALKNKLAIADFFKENPGALQRECAVATPGLMADFAGLTIWTDAYIGDTQHLTLQEHGAYLKLLMIAWRSPGCCLPDDDKRLATMLGVTVKVWRSIKPEVMAFWELRDGQYFQGRLTRERKKVEARSEKGVAAAEKRWKANALKTNNQGDGLAETEHMPQQCTPYPSPYPEDKVLPSVVPAREREAEQIEMEEIEKPEPPPKKKTRRACQLPDGWVPSDKNIQDAFDIGLSQGDIQNEADQFRDYHRGNGNTKKDWDATWRTWARNSIKFKQGRSTQSRGGIGSGTAQAFANVAQRLKSEQGGSDDFNF